MKSNIKHRIYSYVMKMGGEVKFPTFNIYYPIQTIKAVEFKEQFDIDADDPDAVLWNSYVGRVQESINSNYNEWVHSNDQHKMVGVLAFLDRNNRSIKTKHFEEWRKLYNHMKTFKL